MSIDRKEYLHPIRARFEITFPDQTKFDRRNRKDAGVGRQVPDIAGDDVREFAHGVNDLVIRQVVSLFVEHDGRYLFGELGWSHYIQFSRPVAHDADRRDNPLLPMKGSFLDGPR
jgi:hypothetical protein